MNRNDINKENDAVLDGTESVSGVTSNAGVNVNGTEADDSTVYMSDGLLSDTASAKSAEDDATVLLSQESVQHNNAANVQNVPQYPNSGMPQYPNSGMPQYPNSGMPQYPNSGMPQYPNSGMPQYPNSGMPQYPNSGMPQYPNSGIPPYPNTGMPLYPNTGAPYGMPPYGMNPYAAGQMQKRKMSVVSFAVIFLCIVLEVAAAAIAFMLYFNKPDEDLNSDNTNSVNNDAEIEETEQETEQEKEIEREQEIRQEQNDKTSTLPSFKSFEKYKVGMLKEDGTVNIGKAQMKIDGVLYPFESSLYNYENANYVDISVFSELFGLSVVTDIDTQTATLTVNDSTFVITHGMVEGKKTDINGSITSVAIHRPAIMFDNGRMFVSVKGLSGIFDFKTVEWDSTDNCVKIVTKSVKVSL